jgi:hypothetical protein
MLQTIIQFVSHLHSTCPAFREFCVSSTFIQELFGILFPVICSSDHVSAETELNSRDSALTFDGGDVVIRPLVSTAAPPIVRTVTVEDRPLSPAGGRSERLRRGSSFILVTQEPTEYGPSSARLTPGIGSGLNMKVAGAGLMGYNSLVESVMELVMSVFEEMVLERREFIGFGLNTKVGGVTGTFNLRRRADWDVGSTGIPRASDIFRDVFAQKYDHTYQEPHQF